VVLSTWSGRSPAWSPVDEVPDGSNIRIDAPGDDGLCWVPRGTMVPATGRIAGSSRASDPPGGREAEQVDLGVRARS